MAIVEAVLTTVAGAVSATAGVVVGGIVTRRAQDRHWLRDKQLEVYDELLTHYSLFTMELRRAHAERRGWDYDWGAWSAALARAGVLAPTEVAVAIDDFAAAIDTFLDRTARDTDPLRSALPEADFEQAAERTSEARSRLVEAIRQSLR